MWLSGHPLMCCSYTLSWLSWVRPADWFSLSYLFLILWLYLIAQSGCLLIIQFGYFPFLVQDHSTPGTLFVSMSHWSSHCWLCRSLSTYLVIAYRCIPLSVNSFLLRLSFSDYRHVVSSLSGSTAVSIVRGSLGSLAYPPCWLQDEKCGRDQILLKKA